MRYIGSKQKLLAHLLQSVTAPEGNVFLDAFSGSGVVSEAFAERYQVVACDLLYVCSVVTACKLLHRDSLTIDVDETLASLNSLDGIDGFIYRTYTPAGNRKYFSESNGRKIDAIRQAIDGYSGPDKTFLLGCLIESVSLVANTSGTYGAFHKTWDPRSLHPLVLKNHFTLDRRGVSLQGSALDTVRTTPHDVLYLDPPYNNRQYGSYYHVLETIARNDSPNVHGVTGLRDWSDSKSKFCAKNSAAQELSDIVCASSASLVVMSYNNEGLLTKEEIEQLLGRIGTTSCIELPHVRYNSSSPGKSTTIEYIFTVNRTTLNILPYENKIFHQDCIVGMVERIPDHSIDMILTDLPYGLTECRWDSVIPLADLWKQYTRVIKPSGAIVLFGQQPFTSSLVMSNPSMFKYSLVWKKSKTGNFAQAPYRFLCEHEDILVFSNGKTSKNGVPRMVYNPQGTTPCHKVMKGKTGKTEHRGGRAIQADYVQSVTNYPRSILEFPNEGKTVHPTQKPLALCEYLIRTFSSDGGIVLDSCMGSGTTALACRQTSRRFVGFEVDIGNFELCRKRLGDSAVGK